MIEIRYGVNIITDSAKLKKKKRKNLVTDEDACTQSMLIASFERLVFAGREGWLDWLDLNNFSLLSVDTVVVSSRKR